MIHIICDTTACLRDEFVERHDNLHMIPLHIALGGGESVDDSSISTKEVFESYEATKIQPLTSQPSIGAWLRGSDHHYHPHSDRQRYRTDGPGRSEAIKTETNCSDRLALHQRRYADFGGRSGRHD